MNGSPDLPDKVTTEAMILEVIGAEPQRPDEDHFQFLERTQLLFSRARAEGRLIPIGIHPMPIKSPWLERFSLNREASRLLKARGIPVSSRTAPLSQAVLEGLPHWNPRGDRDTQVLLRLAALGEAESPAQFAQALRPFMNPLAWDPNQAEREGLPPYGPESLNQYTPTNLVEEAMECQYLSELLDLLEGQEAETYGMTT